MSTSWGSGSRRVAIHDVAMKRFFNNEGLFIVYLTRQTLREPSSVT